MTPSQSVYLAEAPAVQSITSLVFLRKSSRRQNSGRLATQRRISSIPQRTEQHREFYITLMMLYKYPASYQTSLHHLFNPAMFCITETALFLCWTLLLTSLFYPRKIKLGASIRTVLKRQTKLGSLLQPLPLSGRWMKP
mmetsp:Transcript_50198/g.95898  ORF Transcript_50198/g.95898 Transcript_50198/m.95898 type:complete len:139 (+) Transcript_50198:1148-1564(+)